MLKNLPRPLFAIVWVLFCATPMFAQLSAEQLDKLSAFHYQSVGFSTSEQQLLKVLQAVKLEPAHKGSEQGVRTYEYRENIEGECALFRYYESMLVEIDIIFFPSKVAAQGGAESLLREAIVKFGHPTRQEDKTMLWDFPSIDRLVVVSFENGNWSLHVYHRTRRLAIPEYKDTTAAPRSARITVTEGFAVPYQPKVKFSVPEGVLAAINQQASIDHPKDLPTQGYVIGKQITSFQELEAFECPSGVPERVYKVLRNRIAQDHANDYSTQLYVLKKQIGDYLELESMATPDDMAGSHFFAFRKSARGRHPYDYSTQLYVLRQYINDYQAYRQAGNSGEAISAYMLRFE